MEQPKLHLFLLGTLILLSLTKDVRCDNNFQHGRASRLPRGISRTVAQMFFGGKPVSDKLPTSVTTSKYVPGTIYGGAGAQYSAHPDTFYGQYFQNSFVQPQPESSSHDYISQYWNSDHNNYVSSQINYDASPTFDDSQFNYQSQSSPSYQIYQSGQQQPLIATPSTSGYSYTAPVTTTKGSSLAKDGLQILSRGREVIRDKFGSYMKKLRRSAGSFSFGGSGTRPKPVPQTHFVQPYGHGQMFVDPFEWTRRRSDRRRH